MGCMQSKNGVVKKNADDRALSQVKFKNVGITDFDGVFASADDPVNKVANINNSILQAQENVFDAVLATSGMYYTARLSAGPVSVVVNEVTEEKEKALSADDITAHEHLSKPYNVLLESIDAFNALNVSSEEALEVEVVNNRLVVKDADMAQSASYVNNALFLLRKAARKAAGKESMGFKDVLKEAAVVIKKGGAKPVIKPNMTKLAQGEIDFDANLGKTGPTGQVQKLWDAIAGKKGLLESMQKGASSSTALEGEIGDVKTKVDALPTSVSGVKEKATEANMNPMQMIKVAKAMAANASKFSSASKYMPMLMDTIKTLAADLEDVFKATPDAADEKVESTDTDTKVDVVVEATEADETTKADVAVVAPVVEVAAVAETEDAGAAAETEGTAGAAAVEVEVVVEADTDDDAATATTEPEDIKEEVAAEAVDASLAVE